MGELALHPCLPYGGKGEGMMSSPTLPLPPMVGKRADPTLNQDAELGRPGPASHQGNTIDLTPMKEV